MMNLMTGLGAIGGHIGGWRHPNAWDHTAMNLGHLIQTAKTAERGKFDFLFMADGNAVRQMDKPELFAANSPSDRPTGFEPTTVYAAISQHTSQIGMMATATTTYDSPWLLARRFASLDHLSNGRSSWNIVTGSYPGDSKNFGFEDHMDRVERYARSVEFVEVCKGLWDSWAADAFIEDKATGHYLDPSRVHTLNHHGEYFDVQGPLNVARMPQGYPVLFVAGQSELGRDLAAKHADCVFAVTPTIEAGKAYFKDMKERTVAYGREADHLRVMPGCTVYVAETEAEADDLFDELNSLISPAVGVPYLSKLVEEDMSKYPIDGPMPALAGETVGIGSFREAITDLAKKEQLTVRQTYETVLPSMGHVIFKGNAQQVADQMEEWYKSEACDGFNVSTPVAPMGLEAVVDLLVPELQRRGLFHEDYTGGTLRENLGLPTPKNQFFD